MSGVVGAVDGVVEEGCEPVAAWTACELGAADACGWECSADVGYGVVV